MKTTKKLKEDIQKILNTIVEKYGESKWQDDIPYIHIVRRRHIDKFDNDFADGVLHKEEFKQISGWYDPNDNSIALIVENMKSIREIIETILHEYQHYLQCPHWAERYYKLGYTYENHPYEVQAEEAETKWFDIYYEALKK